MKKTVVLAVVFLGLVGLTASSKAETVTNVYRVVVRDAYTYMQGTNVASDVYSVSVFYKPKSSTSDELVGYNTHEVVRITRSQVDDQAVADGDTDGSYTPRKLVVYIKRAALKIITSRH